MRESKLFLLTEFPELRDRMEGTFGSYYDLKSELPGAYPVFEDVFWDFVVERLAKDDSEHFVERAFSFCERMASSPDIEVVNLLWIAVVEPPVSNANEVQRAWKYIGPKTRTLAREIARRRGWNSSLPQE
jgi:hypothetical protein